MRFSLSLLLAAALCVACDGEEDVRLIIDLRTDLGPSVDFAVVDVAAVPTSSTAEVTTSRRVMAGDDYVAGQRVAEYETLPAGPIRVRVRLSTEAGVLVLERTVRVELSGRTGITIFMTRDCIGVSCPGEECIGGRCVSESCLDLSSDECGGPACTATTDCASTEVCEGAVCGAGVCLYPRLPTCMPDSGVPDGGDSGVLDEVAFVAAADAHFCEKALACSPKIAFFAESLCNPEARRYATGIFAAGFQAFPWLDSGPGATFDPVAARSCLEALAAVPETECGISPPPECTEVFTPTLAAGESCVGNAECVMGLCDEPGGVCPGVCRSYLTEGEDCSAWPLLCAPGLRCAGGACAPFAPAGASCDASTPCVLGTFCDAGTCVSGPNLGEPCTIGFLGYDPCRGDTVCSSGTCVTPVPAGGTCSSTMPCGTGARCVDDGSGGRCQLAARPGDPCFEDTHCPATFACVGGVCEPLGFLGSTCSTSAQCAVGLCDAGRCALAEPGRVCSGAMQCTGSCVSGTCGPPATEGEACGMSPAFLNCEPPLFCSAGVCRACP